MSSNKSDCRLRFEKHLLSYWSQEIKIEERLELEHIHEELRVEDSIIEYSEILESNATSDFNVEKNLQEEMISNQNPRDSFALQNEG